MVEFWQTAVAGAIGVGPALAAVFFGLRGYDRPHYEHTLFDDRRIFFALAVGFVFGTISAAASFITTVGQTALLGGIVTLVLIAVFDEGFKLVYLNRKGYRARFDTTYTGLALGGGVAATPAFATAWGNAAQLGDPVTVLLLLLFGITTAATHAFTGSLIGFGCAFGETFLRTARAILVRIGLIAILLPFFIGADLATSVVSLVVALVLALFLYRFALRHILPAAVPEDIHKDWRRRRRRQARRG